MDESSGNTNEATDDDSSDAGGSNTPSPSEATDDDNSNDGNDDSSSNTPSPSTNSPATVSPTSRSELTTSTIAPTAAPTDDDSKDVSKDDSSNTPSPSTNFPATASPTSRSELTTSTNAPTAAEILATEGSLGVGMVKGTFSATGVSISLFDTIGEEGVVQVAVCALTTCPAGFTSVVVGEADFESRRLVDAKAARRAESRRLLPRRLVEIEAVTFAVPTEGFGGDSGRGGMTGMNYAATLMNQIADPDGLSLAASALGVDIEDLSFENVRYFQGAEVPIAVDLNFDLMQETNRTQEPSSGAAVLAALVIGPLVLLAGCVVILRSWRHRANSNKKRSMVQDPELRRMAFFPMEPRAGIGSADPAVRQQFLTPSALESRPTSATPKGRQVPPQGADAIVSSVGADYDELEKRSSPQAGERRTPLFNAFSAFQASREHLHYYHGAEYADSDSCSDFADLDRFAGTTGDHNMNPLFGKAAPNIPVDVSEGRKRSNRMSHDANDTTGNVNAPSYVEGRPAGAPIATETSHARPLWPHKGPVGKSGGSTPSSPTAKRNDLVKKQVRFVPLPDRPLPGNDGEGSQDGESPLPTRVTNSSEPAMHGQGGEGLSLPRNTGGGEQNDKSFSPSEPPPNTEQESRESRRADIAYGGHHRSTGSSGSTDSSLASLALSPSCMKRYPHLQVAHAAVHEEGTDSWLSSALSTPRRDFDSVPRRDFEEAGSTPSSAPVSPRIVRRRNESFVVTPLSQPNGAEETRRRVLPSAAAAETSTRVTSVEEHRRFPNTWQGLVEAAARETASEKVGMTRSSSMPDVASWASHARNGRRQGRTNWTERYSSVGGESVGGRSRDGVTAPPPESVMGLAYDELFAKRRRSRRAGSPTETKVRFPY
eukprot:g16753.t1